MPGALVLAAGVASCNRESERPIVVLYVSTDEHVAAPVIEAFEQRTGIAVRWIGDTEASKTTGLVERLRRERDRPRADVFWSSEIFMTVALAEEGVLAPHASGATADRPAAWRDEANRWHAFSPRARVLAFRPDDLVPGEVPRSWLALTEPRWRGRIVMADPRFGTTGGHLGAMRWIWTTRGEPGRYERFLRGLARNEVRLLRGGNAAVVEAIVRGEADLGMTDTDDVRAAQALGRSIDMVYPDHAPGVGTLLIPNTVARIAGGPNPEAAAALIDWLLSDEVAALLADSVSGNVPLPPVVAERYPDLAVHGAMLVDWQAVAVQRDAAVREAMRMLSGDAQAAVP